MARSAGIRSTPSAASLVHLINHQYLNRSITRPYGDHLGVGNLHLLIDFMPNLPPQARPTLAVQSLGIQYPCASISFMGHASNFQGASRLTLRQEQHTPLQNALPDRRDVVEYTPSYLFPIRPRRGSARGPPFRQIPRDRPSAADDTGLHGLVCGRSRLGRTQRDEERAGSGRFRVCSPGHIGVEHRIFTAGHSAERKNGGGGGQRLALAQGYPRGVQLRQV